MEGKGVEKGGGVELKGGWKGAVREGEMGVARWWWEDGGGPMGVARWWWDEGGGEKGVWRWRGGMVVGR